MLHRSRFAHYYQKGDDICIFHSLSMDLIFGNKIFWIYCFRSL